MLTDAAGGFVELSTNSHTPTASIWRTVVARDRQCVRPGCCRPATVVELDHRTSFPMGETSTANLQPLCERHHKVKHSRRFSVVREPDGSYLWTSRFGSTFRTPAPVYPTTTWPTAPTDSARSPVGTERPAGSSELTGGAGDTAAETGSSTADGAGDQLGDAASTASDPAADVGSVMEQQFRAWLERTQGLRV